MADPYPVPLFRRISTRMGDLSIRELESSLVDLQTLRPPPGLSQEELDLWTRTCLLAAPFVDSVIKLEQTSQEHAWLVLSSEWGLEISVAERARSTVQNWIRYFGIT